MCGRKIYKIKALGSVDGFYQDEAESKRDERAVILRRLLASKRVPLTLGFVSRCRIFATNTGTSKSAPIIT
jgi:hypothetical protein